VCLSALASPSAVRSPFSRLSRGAFAFRSVLAFRLFVPSRRRGVVVLPPCLRVPLCLRASVPVPRSPPLASLPPVLSPVCSSALHLRFSVSYSPLALRRSSFLSAGRFFASSVSGVFCRSSFALGSRFSVSSALRCPPFFAAATVVPPLSDHRMEMLSGGIGIWELAFRTDFLGFLFFYFMYIIIIIIVILRFGLSHPVHLITCLCI
jgi:hypothetical protein